MKKKIIGILLCICLLMTCMGCGSKETNLPDAGGKPAPGSIRIGALKGPTAMGMVSLMNASEADAESPYAFTLAGSADELSPAILRGELEIAAVPTNLAVVLENKSEGGVELLAVNTLGVLNILEKGTSDISELADLKGKTVFCTGKGTMPEMILRYLLTESGLDPDADVTLEFKSEPAEILALLAQKDEAVVMLPEPQATVALGKITGLRRALDLNEEWKKTGIEGELVQAVLVVQKAFAETYPEALEEFLLAYGDSVNTINSKPAETAPLVEKYVGIDAKLAEKAIPSCNIVCITGEEMEKAIAGTLKALQK